MKLDVKKYVPKVPAHAFRQISATFAASLLSLEGGITFGYTAVLLPQLKNDKNFPYDKSYDSWIASMSPLAMIFGCLFAGVMSDGIGRKMGQLVLVVPFTLGWVIMGLAHNNAVMLIGRFVTGICTGAIRANTIVYIGELTDPKYRPIALFCPSLAIPVGSLISHTVGKYVYWKASCFIFILPNIICFTILMFLKESPLWLLSKGKIDEGIQSFREFRGTDENAEKELNIALEKAKNTTKTTFKEAANIVFSKAFMKNLGIILLLFVTVQLSGANTMSFYAQDIFDKTFSGSIDSFLLMISTDCIKIVSGISICILVNFVPRKPTFVACCFITTLILICLVTYLYLSPTGLSWVAVACIIAYIIVTSAIPSISWSFIAEIFPAKVRGFGSGISSGMSFALLFMSVKLTPQIMNSYGIAALYGSFAVATLVTGTILIFILPDTNGKSLQDIEDLLYNKKKEIQGNEMNTNQSNLSA